MDKKNDLKQFYNSYLSFFSEVEKNGTFTNGFYDRFLAGENLIYQKNIKESKTFDEEWIKTVESFVPSLNKIILKPKESLRLEEEIVAVEKAKKINSQSVRHLSSHTHLIKEVNKDGSIVPKKILTSFQETDYGIYENRFIMTLIERLFIFVRNRYETISNNITSYEKKHFNLDSNFNIKDTNVLLKLDVTFTNEIVDEKVNEYNKSLLKRVDYLNKIVSNLKTSDFMQKMKGQKKIMPPIMKTNILMKDVNYRNSYLLWLFLDRYNTLAFELSVTNKDLTIDDYYGNDVNRLALLAFSSIFYNQDRSDRNYLELEETKITRKSIKQVTTNKDDIVIDPFDIVLEDNSINEYYLGEYKETFNKKFDENLKNTKTYQTGLKNSLRETLKITNKLYESFFEIGEDLDEDIFKQLITELNYEEELEAAIKKANIAKIITEVKQIDYNDSLRLEKKQITDIIDFSKEIIRIYKEKETLTKEELEDKYNAERIRKEAIFKKKLIDDEIINNQKLKDANDLYHKKAKQDLKTITKDAKRDYHFEIKRFTDELDIKLKEQESFYHNKYKLETKLTKEKIRDLKNNLEEELLLQKENLDKEYKEKLEKEKEKIRENKLKALNELKEKLASEYLEQERLKEEKEKLKNEFRTNLRKYKREKLNSFRENLKKHEENQ